MLERQLPQSLVVELVQHARGSGFNPQYKEGKRGQREGQRDGSPGKCACFHTHASSLGLEEPSLETQLSHPSPNKK